MPDPALLTPLGKAMLGSLPPRVRGALDYMAVIHAAAREVELLEAAIETVRAQFNPATADVLLDAWETMLKLPVGGNGASVAARRQMVMQRLSKVVAAGTGIDWENAITALIGYGWSYLEHDPNPPTNWAPNPGFEHDAVGASPAGWEQAGNLATHVVSSSWGDTGAQSLHLVTNALATTNQASYGIVGPDLGPGGQSGVHGWNVSRLRTGVSAGRFAYKVNSLSGTFKAYLEWWCYDSSGTFLLAPTTQVPANLAVGVGSNAAIPAPALPAGTAWFKVGIVLFAVAAGTLDISVDSVGVYLDPPGGVVPDWTSGDSPGWQWLGAAGNSPSQLVTPPDGQIQITLPFPSGSARWIDAINQIRDLTDAHLSLAFVSTSAFQLDVSQMDVQQFGF